jgi:hypothetical protein
VECLYSKTHCANTICNYSIPDKFTLEVVGFGCTLTKPLSEPKFSLRQEVKTGKKWGAGPFNFVFDVCDFVNGFHMPFLNLFFAREQLASVLHGCPFRAVRGLFTFHKVACSFITFVFQQDKLYATNLSINTKSVPYMGPPGDYRLKFTLKTGKYSEVFSILTYGQICDYD